MRLGIKTILRTPVKTLLFFLLISMVSVFLTLGVGIWNSAENMLKEADKVFLTAGEFVYHGGNYPDNSEYDKVMAEKKKDLDIMEFANYTGVLSLEKDYTMRAFVESYRTTAPPFSDRAVITFKVNSYDSKRNAAQSTIVETDYSWKKDIDNLLVLVYPPENEPDFQYEMGHTYTVFGTFFNAGTSYLCFMPTEFPEGVKNISLNSETPFSSIVDVTETDNIQGIEESSIQFMKNVGIMYQVVNDSVNILATKKVEAVEDFQRGKNNLIEGEFFTETDYKDGNACIINTKMAKDLSVGIGDRIQFDFHGKLADEGGFYDTYWPESGFVGGKHEFTVRGIYESMDNIPDVYISYAGQEWIDTIAIENNYNLGRVLLQNDLAKTFQEEIKEKLPSNVRLTVYDQGYEAASMPIKSMKETAVLITAVCGACAILILLFFSYFFIYRNSETVKIMLALGSGARKVYIFLLSGCGAIAIVAGVIGSLIGYFITGKFAEKIYRDAVNGFMFDSRFSISKGIRSNEFHVTPNISIVTFLVTAFVIVLFALFLCGLFAWLTVRMQNPHYRMKKAGRKKRVSARKSHVPKYRDGVGILGYIPFVSLRYAIKSGLRNGMKSVIVVFTIGVVLVFLCIFSGTQYNYRQQLDAVYKQVPVEMRVTNLNGTMVDNLFIPASDVNKIMETDFVEEEWHSFTVRFFYNGVYQNNGENSDIEESLNWVHVPYDNMFAYELFESQLEKKFDPLTFTNDISKSSEFFYTGDPEIVFATGYDQTVLSQKTPIPHQYLIPESPEGNLEENQEQMPVCIVPESFLVKNKLELGEIIYLTLYYYAEIEEGKPSSLLSEILVPVKIAGKFVGESGRDHLYIPWADGMTSLYHSSGFRLKNTEELDELKDWLANSYSQVNELSGNRKWIVIDDTALYRTIENLNRYIGYMKMLYPIVLAVVIGIGVLIANLLLKSRLTEINVLRGLGTGKVNLFFHFFWEQFMLCIPSILIGVAVSAVILGGLKQISGGNILIFMFCYLFGTGIAIAQALRNSIMSNLSKQEG